MGRSILWGAESWTLTKKQKTTLRGVQRHMLRRFLAPARQAGENWIDWVKRATRVAERIARECNVRSWVDDHLAAKWRWAGHLARMCITSRSGLPAKMTFWMDSEWRYYQVSNARGFSARPRRRRSGRWCRWEDEIYDFCNSWKLKAQDRDAWAQLQTPFMARCSL